MWLFNVQRLWNCKACIWTVIAHEIELPVSMMALNDPLGNKKTVKGEITFDLVMGDDMSFVEGCYRSEDGVWHVFMFRKSREGIEAIGIKKNLTWDSGVTGINVIVGNDAKLNKAIVLQSLSEILGISEWQEVRGPDSMQLR